MSSATSNLVKHPIDGLKQRRAKIHAEADPEKQEIQTKFIDQAVTVADWSNVGANLKLVSDGHVACAAAEEVARLAKLYETAKLHAEKELSSVADFGDFLKNNEKVQIQQDFIDDAAAKASRREFLPAISRLALVAGECVTAAKLCRHFQEFCAEGEKVLDDFESAEYYLTTPSEIPSPPPNLLAENGVIKKAIADWQDLIMKRPNGVAAFGAIEAAMKLVRDHAERAERHKRDVLCFKDLSADKTDASLKLNTLKGHPGQAAVAGDIAAMETLLNNAQGMIDADRYASARMYYDDIVKRCQSCTTIADAAAAYDTKLSDAQKRIETCRKSISTLTEPPAAIGARLVTLETDTVTTAPKLGSGPFTRLRAA